MRAIVAMLAVALTASTAAAQHPTPLETEEDTSKCSLRTLPACSGLLLALASRILDCELKAANRYDDGRSTKDLAEQIMGVCAVERFKERRVYLRPFKIPLNDPQTELDDFKRAVETIEMARKNRVGSK